MIAWLVRQLSGALGPYILGVGAALVAALIAANGVQAWTVKGLRTDVAKAELALSQEREQAVVAVAMAQASARKTEQQMAADLAAIDQRNRKRESDAQAATERDIADLRRGDVKLRKRLAAAEASCSVPDAAAAAGVGDGAGGTGLRIEDAEVLVRESKRADTVAGRLTDCQAVVDVYWSRLLEFSGGHE